MNDESETWQNHFKVFETLIGLEQKHQQKAKRAIIKTYDEPLVLNKTTQSYAQVHIPVSSFSRCAHVEYKSINRPSLICEYLGNQTRILSKQTTKKHMQLLKAWRKQFPSNRGKI